jgi:hypothetical protein
MLGTPVCVKLRMYFSVSGSNVALGTPVCVKLRMYFSVQAQNDRKMKWSVKLAQPLSLHVQQAHSPRMAHQEADRAGNPFQAKLRM